MRGDGERPFSGQGGLLRGLRAEVNCREGKRRKERGGRKKERESSVSGLALLPASPLPSPLGLRFSICKATDWAGRFQGLYNSTVVEATVWGHRLQSSVCLAHKPSNSRVFGFLAMSQAPGPRLLSHFPIPGFPG